MTRTVEELLRLATKFQITDDISVESRAPDGSSWAVCTRTGACVAKDNFDRIVEPSPSNRDEDFINLTRFPTLEEALDFADEYLEHLKSDPRMFYLTHGA